MQNKEERLKELNTKLFKVVDNAKQYLANIKETVVLYGMEDEFSNVFDYENDLYWSVVNLQILAESIDKQ